MLDQRKAFRGRIPAYVVALSLLLAGGSIVLTPLFAALAATATFNLRFTTNDTGDIVFVANTVTTCPTTAPECAPARTGGGAKTDLLNNNFYSMVYVNQDTATSGLINSSSADLALPTSLPPISRSVGSVRWPVLGRQNDEGIARPGTLPPPRLGILDGNWRADGDASA